MAAAMILLLLLLSLSSAAAAPGDDDASSQLLLLKSSLSNPPSLSSWSPSNPPCDPKSPWLGVACDQSVVTGLRLESLSLSGAIDVDALSRFKSLRSLSFANNSFSGPIPPLNRLDALKALFLSNNRFSGEIPGDFFADLDHLKKLHLSNNEFTGKIPDSLSKSSTLIELYLDGNKFSGEIPPLDLPALQTLDLSRNALTGPIPQKLGSKFNESSFSGNAGLCGAPIAGKPCGSGGGRTIYIVAILIVAALMVIVAAAVIKKKREGEFDTLGVENSSGTMEAGEGKGSPDPAAPPPATAAAVDTSVKKGGGGGGGSTKGHRRTGSSAKGAAPGSGGPGDLVMVNEEKGVFGLQDLMKAAAEVMGNGGLGSAYKAVMGNGVAVAVKRIREMNRVGKETFDVEMRRLGRLKHKNVLPPLAYHYRKEEKLLISEYIPKGSLLYVLHGDRGADHEALDWPTRLKIIVGIAQGMSYLHAELNTLDIPHGNLKSGNVLLAADFEPLLVDYAFVPLVNPSQASLTMFAYKSPESLSDRHVSPKSDVYCLGILILELLTGKFPSQYLNNTKGGTDVVRWAASAVAENRVAELLDPAITTAAAKAAVPEMERVIAVGADCIEADPARRPEMREVRERMEEIAAAAAAAKGGGEQVTSASSHATYVKEGLGSLSANRAGSITDRSRSSGDNFSFAIS